MNIYPFQAIFPKEDLITSADSFFGSMKYQFTEYYKTGFFDKSPQEALYLYQITHNGTKNLGLVAATDIKDFTTDKVLKHEKTLAAKEQNMMQLMLQRNALIKPVLLAYKSNKLVVDALKKARGRKKPILSIEFENEKTEHKIWKLSDADTVESIKKLFKRKIPKAYIADGHHRSSTSAILYESENIENAEAKFGKLLTIYFPMNELEIWDYNRVVEVFNTVDMPVFLTKLSKYCKIKTLKKGRKPKDKFEMTMYMSNYWFSLKWKQKVFKKYAKQKILLDSELFNTNIMGDILGVADVRESKKIKYFSGKEGTAALEEEVNKHKEKVAFFIYPVLAEELLQIADQKKTLPPKSTWFEPRIKNGIIAKEF